MRRQHSAIVDCLNPICHQIGFLLNGIKKLHNLFYRSVRQTIIRVQKENILPRRMPQSDIPRRGDSLILLTKVTDFRMLFRKTHT